MNDMPGKTEEYPENGSEQHDNTFYLPKESLGGKEYKAGEEITLKVVGHTSEGELEVKCCEPGEEGGDKMGDFDSAMGPEGQGPDKGMEDEGGQY